MAAAAVIVMDVAFTALSPHASCDTRRKPQTPGTAEEHKRQGTPRQLCPRHELRSCRGWACVCHMPTGGTGGTGDGLPSASFTWLSAACTGDRAVATVRT